jgi:hypothetical protein
MEKIDSFEKFLLESYSETNMDLVNEEIDALLFEAGPRRKFNEIHMEAEMKLKEQLAKYTEMIKNNPEKADVYKAQIDLVNAKTMVLKAKERLQMVKSKA